MSLLQSTALLAAVIAAPTTDSYDSLYARIIKDANEGRPVTVTIFVALCDSEHQGVIIDKYPHMCAGNPRRNLYWTTKDGLKGYLNRQGWRRIAYEEPASGPVAARGVWHKRLVSGGRLRELGAPQELDFRIDGLAYRGPSIGQAVLDFLAAANNATSSLSLAKGSTAFAGDQSHIVGFMGHNYLLDIGEAVPTITVPSKQPSIAKGVFVLSCLSDDLFRPILAAPGLQILLLNTTLTYPTGWTVGGMLSAVSLGLGPDEVRISAVREFARVQKKSLDQVLPRFSNVK